MNNILLRLFWCFICLNSLTALFGQSTDCLARVDELVDQKLYVAAAGCYLASAQATEAPADRAAYALEAGKYFRRAEVFDSARIALTLVTDLSTGSSRSLDSLRALAFHTLGLVYYKEEKLKEAVVATKKAADIRDSLYTESNVDCARSYYSLGFYYHQLSELEPAEAALQESYRQYSQASITDTSRLIRTLNALATVYRDLNDRQLVSSSVAQSVALSSQYYRNDFYELGDAYYRSAASMFDLGLSDQFIEYANLAAGCYQKMGDYEWEGAALNLAASGYLEKKEYRAALGLFEKALSRWLQLDFYVLGTAGCYYNIGVCQYKLNQWAAANRNGKIATELGSKEDDPGGLAQYYQLVGISAARLDKEQEAATAFNQSINLLFDGSEIPSTDKVPTELLLPFADVLDDRATYYSLTNQRSAAEADYQTVFALQDRIRADLNSAESQQYISKQLRPIFERAITLQRDLFDQNQNDDHLWNALVLAERAKAFSLLAAMETSKRDQPRRERELRREIAQLERTANKTELGVARLELQRLLQHSDQTDFTPRSLNPVTLRKYLKSRDLHLLEYVIGEENNYLISVTPGGDISMNTLDAGDELASEIARFRQVIEASAYKEVSLNKNQQQLDADFKVASLNLSSKLFPESGPGGQTLPENLLIVPDNYLAFVPFGALLTGPVKDDQLNYQTLPYLQRGRQLSFSYSAQYLLELAGRMYTVPQRNLLALAPTFNGGSTTSTVGSARSAAALNASQRSLPGLLPLRYNQEEVDEIAKIVPATDVFVGQEARRSVFDDSAEDYRFLHLSSHALVDADDPNHSFIAFSQTGDSLEANEMLFLNDLYAMNLNAELAVLSACETSMGRYAPGEGVLSLARAFARAGAASTLTTLWKVDDEATKEMMVRFYAALNDHKSRSAAVTATFDHATSNATFAHPYFWSALTLYGSPDEIDLAGNSTPKWVLYASLFVIGLLALGGLFLRFRK